MSADGVVEAHVMDDDGLTIRDEYGACLVVERFDDGMVAAWIAPPGESDGHSVRLSPEDRRRLAAYVLGGAA